MQIIVLGCGKVGATLAQVMSEDGHDVVIVDNDSVNFKLLSPSFNGVTITGVPIDEDVLKHAGIEVADVVAAVTPNDNVNIMACQIAKEIFNVPIVIARIYNPEREHIFHQFGFQTICPTNMTVDEIRAMVLGKERCMAHSFGNTTIDFIHQKVEKHEEGKKIGAIKQPKSGVVFGVIKNGSFHFANSGMKLENGDVLVISKKTV
jgi:trk system potassium uptake protein TrkA